MGLAVLELDEEPVGENALDGGDLPDPGAGLEGPAHLLDELRIEDGAARSLDAHELLALAVGPAGGDGRLDLGGGELAALRDEAEDLAVDEEDDEGEARDEDAAEGLVLVARGEGADSGGALVPIKLAQPRDEFPQHSCYLSAV